VRGISRSATEAATCLSVACDADMVLVCTWAVARSGARRDTESSVVVDVKTINSRPKIVMSRPIRIATSIVAINDANNLHFIVTSSGCPLVRGTNSSPCQACLVMSQYCPKIACGRGMIVPRGAVRRRRRFSACVCASDCRKGTQRRYVPIEREARTARCCVECQ
jgi:hypothetical protein